MPTFPVRRLGAGGVVTDMHPADIESAAIFTAGCNVRFKNGRVTRGPAARTLANLPHDPGHVLAIPPGSSGYDEIVSIAHDFSTIKRLNGDGFDDLTPVGHSGLSGSQVITSSFLGGVSYINRESHVPLYKAPGDSAYANLPAWETGDRCRVLRAYKDQLIALGVTKGGTFYPTMVKWSDITGFGAPPGSWDTSSTTNSAGENIVNGMKHVIIDGLDLRDSFVLYCSGSVWLMDYIGGNDIFGFRKLFDEVGVIAPNCAVQVGGLHYVFDRNDIYVHDGVSPRSIADEKVKEFIFDALDFAKAGLCFVQHDAKLTEIRFCYPSADRLVGFQNPTTGCNRAAVFNYTNGTWTFYDMPNVVGATKAALVSVRGWGTDEAITWDQLGGLWMTTEGDEDRHCMFVARSDETQGLPASRLYGFDLLTGGRLTHPVAPETVKPAFVERIGLDLDELGKNLTQYINPQTIWPQMSIDNASDCYWQFGGSDLVNKDPEWGPEQPFDPDVDSKIDIGDPSDPDGLVAGKYLGYRFGCRGMGDFKLSGFDFQLIIRGRR